MPKIVYKRINPGKGKTPKWVELDDGQLIHYKDYAKEHPETYAQLESDFNAASKTAHADTTTTTTTESSVVDPAPLIKNSKGPLRKVDGTLSTRTLNGTPVNIYAVNQTPTGEWMSEVLVIVRSGESRSYKTSVSVSDLVRPESCPPEFPQEVFDRMIAA